ncbi:alpha/beta fold hydrolase [Paenibacillus sp. N1-5-1-14]|uniref:alpha/beta hydrolase family protein n=1 Tax=Paenibacillus radicibacter TaxID=2972488 RepID=UPI00215922B0|nr:alpha/beta fold hydrolase [Paenibacillus radicibacter]MCR8643486.1 alpha/beta fold hydrolase [Paenibacillus radicibacter]
MKKKFGMLHKVATASLATALWVSPIASAAAVGSEVTASSNQAVAAESLIVPVRAVGETIGASVKWDEATSSVTVVRGQTQLQLKVGESTAVVNGKTVDLGVKVEFIGDRIQVPLSILQDTFESKIGWDTKTGKAVLAKGDVTSAATSFVHAFLTGDVQGALGLMNDKLKAALPAEVIGTLAPNYQAIFGQIDELVQVNTSKNAVHENVELIYKASNMPLHLTIRLDSSGLVDDMYVSIEPTAAPYEKPKYDDAKLYTEKDIVVGSGEMALPGTLTMPVGKGNVPVVILVHGSGPNDRDETFLSVKPFRDLAVGLAAQGIAVIRYEKVTREHTAKSSVAAGGKFSVKEETIDDAIRAVQLAKTLDGIDPKRIIVAGHSQGGMMMPRIIEADTNHDIAKAVIISGPANSLEDALIEQTEYALESAKLMGQPTEPIAQRLDMFKQQVALLKDPQYSVSNVPQGFALGDPYWWYDLRNYSGAAIAKNQKTPLLIMQGENDAQVLAHHLDNWKKALSNRTDVTYSLYPKVTHFLIESEGRSTGMEHLKPANVSEAIINDIVKFIKN